MLIKNCRIVSSKGVVEGSILVENGRIKRVARALSYDGRVIDARGRLVMPGIVDAHVHVRDWEEAGKEDYISASMAALAGGVTAFLEMPNTSPPVNTLARLRERIRLGERRSMVDFGIHFGFTPGLPPPKGLEAPSVKVYMDAMSQRLLEELEPAFTSSALLSLHCEDPRIIRRNQASAPRLEGPLAHALIRERKAEIEAVKTALQLAEKHGRRVHICHVTLPESVELLGSLATCEATPHHLLLTEEELKALGGLAKTNPPLRSRRDMEALWKALQKGRIDVIASDHAPHARQEKTGDALSAPSGIPNLEVMLRLMLHQVNRGLLSLEDVARMMCENPARIFGVRGKGFIKPGADADLLILDMKAEKVIKPEEFYSKAKYSPFAGWRTKGCAKTVLLRGELAFEDGELHARPGQGSYLYRQL